FGLYLSWRGKSKFSRTVNLVYAWISVLSTLLIFGFFYKTTVIFSRFWLVAWSVASLAYFISYRIVLDLVLNNLRRKGINRKKIAIFGAGQVGIDIQKRISNDYESGFDIVAFLDDNKDLVGSQINGVHVYSPDDMISKIESCHELWIALPLRAEER